MSSARLDAGWRCGLWIGCWSAWGLLNLFRMAAADHLFTPFFAGSMTNLSQGHLAGAATVAICRGDDAEDALDPHRRCCRREDYIRTARDTGLRERARRHPPCHAQARYARRHRGRHSNRLTDGGGLVVKSRSSISNGIGKLLVEARREGTKTMVQAPRPDGRHSYHRHQSRGSTSSMRARSADPRR